MPSIFSAVPEDAWVARNDLAFAVREVDGASPGHTLVIPFREVATWWDVSGAERAALLALVDEVKASLDEQFRPDGYHVGFSSGAAAGQTVPHLSIHVIPLSVGERATGFAAVTRTPEPVLIDSREQRMLRLELVRCLINPEFDRIDLVVSFVMKSGLALIGDRLVDAVERGAGVRVLTTDYLHVTDADALSWLLDRTEESDGLRGSFETRVFSDPATSFHPKGYLFRSSKGGLARGFIGSSNLSGSGIDGGVEWNLSVTGIGALAASFDVLWTDPRSRPLTHSFVRRYRASTPPSGSVAAIAGLIPEPPLQPVAPREVQRRALDALTQTRIDGFDAGLVVLATGLGKTWLAAFDSSRPQFRRTLFIAHREEILRQSRDVFRQVLPDAELGLYLGSERQSDADVVFASVQTLARHLGGFARDEFDYLVVDEFHHAAAASYRRVLAHFAPKFLLGLTATPERLDGADLLGLCDDNLVFECGIVEGIDSGDLVPFVYRGVRDTIDYTPIPWRSGRFDPEALREAEETRQRARQVLDEWRAIDAGPTLAFCSSVTHADFMRDFFIEQGVTAVSVHSGLSSDPRGASVDQLRSGVLQVLFTVDVFNEGVDIPAIGTVLMLRPTASPVVFLQQLGRGLRRAEGKNRLRVIDFIGNHRSFLIKPRVLLGLAGEAAPSAQRVRRFLHGEETQLPAGCSVTFDVEVIDVLGQLLSTATRSVLAELCLEIQSETGRRPSALQAFRAGANPASARGRHGHWFAFLADLGLLDDDERAVLDDHGDVLRRIETEPTTKAYKLVTLKALLQDGALVGGTTVAAVAARAHRLVAGDPRLVADVQGTAMPDPRAVDPATWAKFWRRWPLEHLANDKSGPGLFRLTDDRIEPAFRIPPDQAATFDAMVAELVDWRLAAYLLRRDAGHAIRLKVSHSPGGPMLFLDRSRYPATPSGETEILIDDRPWIIRFVKVAANVGRPIGDPPEPNQLRALLKRWFGENAGASGTNHAVLLEPIGSGWALRPERPTAERDTG
jgi:superfamily II DNA or RNA helicase/diadenosine tetraphosphate (Ap4A) HIT family hydrolase